MDTAILVALVACGLLMTMVGMVIGLLIGLVLYGRSED
jgi:hypothetical protein